MPAPGEIQLLKRIPGLRQLAARLERRVFPPLAKATVIQDTLPEWGRIFRRLLVGGPVIDEAMAYTANDWLMRTMARECKRPTVSAVHSYEDCSLLQFIEAKRLGKGCIYDMPIGYYPAWKEKKERLEKEFEEWLPRGGLYEDRYVRPAQKKKEMELADLVIGPSTFVARTIEQFHHKSFALAPYGVDSEFWHPNPAPTSDRPVRFIYAGQVSLRKGTPLLLNAWERAGLKDSELLLVGGWQLSSAKRGELPPNVRYLPPCSARDLRFHYQSADFFVFPSHFEGFGLVLLEAMACGLPLISSECTAAPDFLTPDSGWVVCAENSDAWVEALRRASADCNRLPRMKAFARQTGVEHSWARYRAAVSSAMSKLPT